MKNQLRISFIICSIFFSLFAQAQDQSSEASAEELAKKLANPVASLISSPFQQNADFGIGDLNGAKYTVNFQPVVPISLSQDLTLITRLVAPIISQYNISGVGNSESGLSDILISAFVSPTPKPGGLIWGVGPALFFPTGTNEFLTTKQFAAGPSIVALKQTGGLTIGALVNQIWSYAGNDERPDINQLFLQPFIVYNWKTGAGAGATIEYTQNWEGNTSTLWIIPSVSGVTSLGKQKLQFLVGPKFNVIAPSSSRAKFGIRAQISFIFPK
ncbi:hypothetical protein [Gaetbulibacter saemankumensis]|uniref:hypothetical protein n=1 Tax=Gaetbulibacter saemankumensis TaxID=311208 RepID=UPI00041440BC|nr:hypothetical protein [Gaetbulibacter saemankumensis]